MPFTATSSLQYGPAVLEHASQYPFEHYLALAESRPPDFVIGPAHNPYLRRWHLVRDRAAGNTYLHQILRDDDDRALHDHPWDSQSHVLAGVLREIMTDGERLLGAGTRAARSAESAHRLEVVEGPVWSLFTTGPWRREWGFHCPNGWRHWRDFTDSESGGGQIGRGCA